MTKPQCKQCGDEFAVARAQVLKQYRMALLCLSCGEGRARQHKHTIIPLHKSAYQPITDLSILRQLNKYTNFGVE